MVICGSCSNQVTSAGCFRADCAIRELQRSAVAPKPQQTYVAKLFAAAGFQMSGTLDGFIDFAAPRPGGLTHQLTLHQARALASNLLSAVSDVEKNCLYDRDTLLEKAP